MKIQSLSVVVPNGTCVNKCPFCVSRMHCDNHPNLIDENQPLFDLHLSDYLERLAFARDNGCNTVMLTGTSEPQQNRKFLAYFGMMNQMLPNPFKWIEMQTTGVLLNQDYLRFLRNHVGVNLISLSLCSLDGYANAEIIGSPDKFRFTLPKLCQEIKDHGFSLRLSLNLTYEFNELLTSPQKLFDACKNMCADQVTLRVLYTSNNNTPQDEWIKKNRAWAANVSALTDYIRQNGSVLGVLPHGAVKYSIGGMSVVIDRDCMDKAEKTDENYKYLILQPDCKLYSQWDDPASLIF